MNKCKHLLFAILATCLLSLSSCGIFNDDDMAIHNSYNLPTSEVEDDPNAITAGGVKSKVIAAVPDAYCFKNIAFGVDGKVTNTYKDGGVNHTEYAVNGNEDYDSTKANNNYDLYVPNTASRTDKHTVILFIHGGAWVSGFKTDVNPYVHEFANRGYITATIKYTLLKKTMDNPALSIFRDLDEIDACITSIKNVLVELGFDITKTELVIGGASSGAHLSMLYAFSRGNTCVFPIKFIVDAVGPVDIKPESWKRFRVESDAALDGGLTASAIEAQNAAGNIGRLPVAGEDYVWCDYQTMRIANGMCGIPFTLEQVRETTDDAQDQILYPNEASISMTKPGGGEDQLSVTYWMDATKNIPMVCAYAGKDTVVGINQYARLETALDTYAIKHEFFYFRNSNHTDIDENIHPDVYHAFLEKIDEWCEADTIV